MNTVIGLTHTPRIFRKYQEETAKSIDRAFKFAAGFDNGVVFASDWGGGKQFYVLNGGVKAVYDYLSSLPMNERTYYEVVTHQQPARLYFDLDLSGPREHLQDLCVKEKMDGIERRVIEVTITALEREYGLNVPPGSIIVLNSDGPHDKNPTTKYKASRHLVFPEVFFADNDHHMKAFVKTHVLPKIPEALDTAVYTKTRQMRFFGHHKIGSNRVLKSHLEEGTPERHFHLFKHAFISSPLPPDTRLLECAAPQRGGAARPPKRQKTKVTPPQTPPPTGGEVRAWVQTLISQYEDAVVQHEEPLDDGRIRFTCVRTRHEKMCRLGGTHKSQNFSVTINLTDGSVIYFCHGNLTGHPVGPDGNKQSWTRLTEPLPEALRAAPPQMPIPTAECFEPALYTQKFPTNEAELQVTRKYYLTLMNHFFASMTFKPDTVIMVKYYEGSNDAIEDYQLMGSEKFLRTFRGMPIVVKFTETPKGPQPVSRPLLRWWLEHRERRVYRQIGFYPNPEKARRFARNFNMFGGLPFDSLPVPDELDMDLLQPVLDHIRLILAGGAADHYEYQLDWYAACLQLRRKLGVIMIYLSSQGAGKDIIVGDDGLMGIIYGKYHQKLAKIEHLLKDFNADAMNKLFCDLAEVTPYNRSHRNADHLKDVFNARKQRVELKGVDAAHIDDERNFVATTQNEDGFKFEQGERRQYQQKCADTYAKISVDKGLITAKEKRLYFARLAGARTPGGAVPLRQATETEMEAVAKQFFWFCMRRDISKFDPSDFPSSATRDAQMGLHRPLVESFLEAWADGALIDEPAIAWKVWEQACQQIYYARTLNDYYCVYLEMENERVADRSARHLSTQLRKYPHLVQVYPDETRKSGGVRFILKGHPHWEE